MLAVNVSANQLLLAPQGCVENAGRPAAAALAELVRATACAFRDGHSMDKLRLEVEHGGLNEVNLKSGTCCLTETDKQYRRQFLDTVSCCIIQTASMLSASCKHDWQSRLYDCRRCTSPCRC